MGRHLHALTRSRIRRQFIEGKTAGRAALFAVLDRCPACAAYYRSHQALESALCASDAPFTQFSIERTGEALFGAQSGLRERAPLRRAAVRWASALTAAVAAMLLVFLLVPFGGDSASDRFPLDVNGTLSPVTLVARGGAPRDAAADIGFRLFRVTGDGAAVEEGSDLMLNDIITFTYTQVNEPGGYLTLFGVQESGEIRWYYPGYDEAGSRPVAGDKVDEPLADGFALTVNHAPGRLRITALFTDAPLTKAEVEAAVDTSGDFGVLNGEPAPLVLEKYPAPPAQYSVIVEIAGRK